MAAIATFLLASGFGICFFGARKYIMSKELSMRTRFETR
jgi:hypothetical protein